VRLPPRTLKNLGQLWITVDNHTGDLGDRFAQLVGGVRLQAVRGRFSARLVGNARNRRELIPSQSFGALFPTLHFDGFDRGGRGFGIKVAAASLDRLQVVVKLIDERNASGDVEADHRFIAHLV
jgi:hypothetical protein